MNQKTKNILIAIAIPVVYAIIARLAFDIKLKTWNNLFRVMSLTFLALLPTVMGALTVYLSNYEKAKKITYRIFLPWVPVIVLLIITLAFNIEGWGCWVMILPVFLVTSSIGGLFGGYLKMQKGNDKLKVSILILLPFLLGPIENLIKIKPTSYEVYDYIDIDAPIEKIWDNVTRVSEIPKEQDKGYLSRILSFPRPIKAELDFEGVGAYREAIFEKGLVLHETVTEYIDNEKMTFTINAYPHEIPSTTFDEHIIIGGEYFDVQSGTYELEKLPTGLKRLHLYSYFTVNTTFNFYAAWWAKWIMKDIQYNILQIQKIRSEGN